MKLNVGSKDKWKISKEAERHYNTKHLEDTLGFFNRLTHSNVFMVDYRKQRLLVGSSSVPSITGYSWDFIRKEGFKIYHLILTEKEQEILQKIDTEAFKLFDRYSDFKDRLSLEISYDIMAKHKNGREFMMCHRLVPFQLCDDGNLWLAMCIVSTNSLVQKTTRACVENHRTKERFDFIDKKFVPSDYKCLSSDEMAILGYLADGVAMKQISEKMGTSLRIVERKKKDVLNKLSAATQAAAVYKAKTMGLI